MKGLRQDDHLSSKWSIWGGGAKVHGGMICVQNRGRLMIQNKQLQTFLELREYHKSNLEKVWKIKKY